MVKHIIYQLCIVSFFCFPVWAKDDRPNVVFMLVDNVGWGDPGIYGGGILRGAPTPRIDTIAAEGMMLLNFNAEPMCTMARASLMTGRYTARTITTADKSNGRVLPKSEITIAELFSDAGYATATYGKWDLGHEKGLFPTDRGFDEWYGIPTSTSKAEWDTTLQYDPEVAPMQRVLQSKKGETPKETKIYDITARRVMDSEITNRSIGFMKKNVKTKKPFFLLVAFTQTCSPTKPHLDFAGKTGNGDYADSLAELDYRTGQVMDAISDLGIEDNTIVIWASDNGSSPYYPHGSDGPWNKPSIGDTGLPSSADVSVVASYEGSTRTSFMIRWPHKVKPGSVNNEIVHITDMMPTFAYVAGYKLPDDRIIDGVDQMDFFTGRQEKSNREDVPVYDMNGKLQAYKWRNWKIHFTGQRGIYNLIIDPQETHPMGREAGWAVETIRRKVEELDATLKEE